MGTTAGSPIYMDPLILQEQKYTTKCDIWSMGIIFYELLTKTYPWHAPNQKALAFEIHTKPLRIPTHLSPWSKTLLSRMLVIDEKQRIGWDELFEYLGLNGQISPRRRAFIIQHEWFRVKRDRAVRLRAIGRIVEKWSLVKNLEKRWASALSHTPNTR